MEPNTTLAPQGARGTDPAPPAIARCVINGQILIAQAPPPLDPYAYLRPIEQITSPDQLPPGVLLTSTSTINLRLQSPSPFGFHFHWIKEAVRGVLQGTTGLCLDAATEAQLTATLTGSYTATLTRDDHGAEPWLRLTLNRASEASLQGSAKATITANVDTCLPAGSDELLKAIFGTHSLQWLRATLADIGSVRWKQLADGCEVSGSALEALLEAFEQPGARAESVLWKAAGQPTALSELLSWSYSIANDGLNLTTFRARLQRGLEQDPAFAASIVAQWLEAVAGCSLTQISTEDAWTRIHDAATLLDRLTNVDKLSRDASAILTLLLRLPAIAAQELDPFAPASWALPRLQQLFGSGLPIRELLDRANSWLPLRNRIYQAAREALQKQLPAELSILLESSTGGTALVDASFAMTPAGLELLRRILGGDLTPLYGPPTSDLQPHHGLLTHHLRRSRHIEIHLPFLDTRSWQSGVTALVSAEVLCDAAGRLITWHATACDFRQVSNECHSKMILAAAFSSRGSGPINDNFDLTFEDTRQVSALGHHEAWFRVLQAYGIRRPELPSAPVQATLTLSLPGRFAEAWTRAPHSKDIDYFPTMCRVSRAMQAAVRYWLPTLYFADLEHFRTPGAAFPLLAYQYSAPYADVKARHLSYDFMNSQMVSRALNSAAPGLRQALPDLQCALAAAGMQELAATYDPDSVEHILSSVQIQNRNFNALLAADTYFAEEMIRLADMTRELRATCIRKPAMAIRDLTRYSADLVKALHGHLRRLYAGDDFVALGSLLLIAATAALAGGGKGPIPITATLKLEQSGEVRVYTSETPGT